MGGAAAGGRGGRARKAGGGGDPLEVLRVVDSLEVGPVRLEPARLTAPYRVARKGSRDVLDLVYRFEEPVFDPQDPRDRNLAAVMAAQVALNYGLFCDEIVFRGPHDETDILLLEDMCENTSREIYVKKFLEPNPFLTGEAASLPAVLRERYTRATLSFPDRISPRAPSAFPEAERREGLCGVLSSGGKDSLLSFGLLRDAGWEVHPVFGNESGRHWFTALNAHRWFRQNVPGTSRVWMNSDRLFAWMLRHLPFVRPDFASLRSDEYPIRLWTVAVFLFGALPVLRRRGIGHLVIGDEYDTTDRRSHEGIRHYNGLFDQSRWFDAALSRYYARKGWALSQFSVVRPLSELLIEKVLVERYPDLLRNQVSCHAAHKEGDRVHPCGRCEKCRRIVGMIVAVGGDPTSCGYSEDQVRHCLEDLPRKGVHQEEAGARQLLRMLADLGRIPPEEAERAGAAECPEVLNLRFDEERSPVETTPVAMRRPLFEIYLRHARGALRLEDGRWLPFDPLQEPVLSRPYPFESPKAAAGDLGGPESGDPAPTAGPHPWILGELNWPEAGRRFREVDVALLPVGAIEQHGPHLPLDTDAFDAEYLAREVAARCRDPKPIVLPLIPYGVSYHHEDFPGTISVSNDTLAHLVHEIGLGLARHGVRKLVIINGHGGNEATLNFAAQMINRDTRMFVCVDTGESSDIDIYSMTETPGDLHAGEIETSTTMALRPHLVRMEEAVRDVAEYSSRYLNPTSRRGVSWHAFTKRYSKSGVMGDATKASVEKGRKMWQVMIEHLVAFVEDIKPLSLDEIYQKRL